ncbi:MAG: ABC transporter substrate-binding protein [Thermoplasmata archaeon]
MEKRSIYALIAIIIVIVIIIAAISIVVFPSKKTTTTSKPSLSLSISSSAIFTSVGQQVSFTAFVTGGTPSNVTINFGDGSTYLATYSSSIGGYPATHVYNLPGKYLVTVSTNYEGYTFNNYANIFQLTVSPSTISPSIASEITIPTIIIGSQIGHENQSVSLVGSYLQPPTETNWTIGYYIWNFGDGIKKVDPAIYNASSGVFLKDNISHSYSSPGIYVISLSILTFNSSGFTASIYNGNNNLTYYPVSNLPSILSSGKYQNTTYLNTFLVLSPGTYANVSKTSIPVTNPSVITNAELVPGGPYSFDPAIDYETVGFEIIANVYETLVAYNGSSTSSFNPVIAKYVPTIANGGISPDGKNYTFYIRSGLKFANGDSLNVWDVYISYVRALLFMLGSPGTPDWIIAQDLLPGGGFLPDAVSYQNITNAISYDNATQSITFHLLKPDPAFLDYVADALGCSILDWNWLVQHGAGITFTPAGFQEYMNYSDEANYNNYIRWNTMGSGPYEIQTYVPGQDIILVPNPYFTPIPGVPGYNHKANDTIYIEWVKDPSTEYMMLESGEADIYTGTSDLPTNWYPIISKMESQGKLSIYEFPTMTTFGFAFNFNVNTSMMRSFGAQYHIPANYFQNLDVRRAFAYAFNYTDYINKLVGNSIYGANFSFHYTGFIPYGMLGYISPQQMEKDGINVPYYDLSMAKQYLMQSGMYNVSINIPVVVYGGDPTDYAAASMWATAMNSIDPNILMTPLVITFSQWIGYQVPGQNPMPIYVTTWIPDYPYPSDIVGAFYAQGGTYPLGSGLNPQDFNATGNTTEANVVALMNQYIQTGEYTPNETQSLHYYDLAEEIAVNYTFYIYTQQLNWFWYYSPYLNGAQYEENPVIGGGGTTLYFYLSK